MHQKIGEYMTDVECDYCHGARLKDEYLSVRINEKIFTKFVKCL